MPFSQRVRQEETWGPKGSWRRFGEVIAGQQIIAEREKCDDWVDPGDCHPLYIAKTYSEGGQLHSKYDPGYWGSYWEWYRCDIFNDPDLNFPHWDASLEGNKSIQDFATDLLKRTNPSKPHVDIPVSLFELGDVMHLIKNTGDTVIKKAAGNNLKVQFGLLPLIGDMSKLTQFDHALIRRMKMFEKLQSSKGYRRSVDLAGYFGAATVFKWMQSVGGLYGLNFDQRCTRKFRGHVRWIPDVDFKSLDKAGLLGLAASSLLGTSNRTGSLSTIWEAMPWSWLIDWGSSLGSYFAATRNSIGAYPSHVLIMKETRSIYESPYYQNSDLHLMPSRVTRVEKRRYTDVTPTFSAHVPFLTANQMGILASLSVTRR